MLHRLIMSALFGLLVALADPAHADPISLAGKNLAERIDALDVAHRWPAGEHVDWETGIPDGRPESHEGRHTHCSAFVASAAEMLGIYILRPPQHSQILLANAQYDWLQTQGATFGWQPVADALTAQKQANLGWLVVAVYRNHHDNKPGHIAIVRPSLKSAGTIATEGPDVTQAGATNYQATSLRNGFAGHPAAWGRGEVRYYAHVVDLKRARRAG